MTAPVVKVELGFGSTWQTEPASISWTDVTQYVLQPDRIVTQRGATAARGQVDVGSLGLSLKNADRRFDPTHAAGPYYANLKPGVPVRVRATPAGQSIASVWYGSVAKWPQRYDLGNTFAWVPIEAWDGFDKLARAKIPRSVLEKEVLADGPVAYWRLDETSGSVMVDSSGNGKDGTYVAGTTSLSVAVGDAAPIRGIDFDGEHYGFAAGPPAAITARPCVVEAVVRVDPDVVPAALAIYRSGTGNADEGVTLQLSSTPGFAAVFRDGGTNIAAASDAVALDDVIHVAGRGSSSSASSIYINGVVSGTNTSAGSSDALPAGSGIGARKKSGGSYDFPFEGVVADVAIFDSDIGAVRIAAHASAALAPLDEQTADERAGFVLDEIDWPTNLRDMEAGRSILGPATFKPGDGALEYLRLVVETEDGLMFTTADGKLRLLDRYWRWLDTLATVSQFTFTDAGSQGYAEFQLDLDDELLVNVARLTRRDGTEQVASDATSVATYGEAEKQLTNLLHRTDAETRALAEWTVATQSEPLPRIPKIRVPLHRYSAADQASVLALELGYRVTCLRTPQGTGSQIDLDFVIDGIRHDVGEGEWWAEFYVSPAPDSTVNLFILDTSELDGPDVLAY